HCLHLLCHRSPSFRGSGSVVAIALRSARTVLASLPGVVRRRASGQLDHHLDLHVPLGSVERVGQPTTKLTILSGTAITLRTVAPSSSAATLPSARAVASRAAASAPAATVIRPRTLP